MLYRYLGNTDLQVSTICFGGWQIGGIEWGHISFEDAGHAINVAIDQGVNFFDTADYYGHGRSEEILGKILGPKRRSCIIATKGGLVRGRGEHAAFNGTPKHFRNALHESLKRLKTDYIDLYQLHWPDPKVPIEESVAELVSLQKKGLIRYIGLSNFTPTELRRARQIGSIESIQVSYNMFYREVEEGIMDFCDKHQISLLAYNPLARGLLAGKYSLSTQFEDIRRNDPMFRGDKYRFNIEAVDQLKQIARLHNVSILSLVLSWMLRTQAVTSLIVGIRNASQIREICQTPVIDTGISICEAIDAKRWQSEREN